MANTKPSNSGSWIKSTALWLGPLAFALFLYLGWSYGGQNDGLSRGGYQMIGLTIWMAFWWLTECIPIPATSLLPLGILPILGILNSAKVAQAYGHKMNLLLMGGFMLARAIEKWGLHRRIALNVVSRFGSRPGALLLGFMVATAILSMWISNTATTLMMLPIALACVGADKGDANSSMATAFVLGIAYAASIGGIGTPVGTPPNLIFMAAFEEACQNPELGLKPISFLAWMKIGVPVVIVMIPLAWFLIRLRFGLNVESASLGDPERISNEKTALGNIGRGELLAALLFGITAFLWVFRAPISFGEWYLPGWSQLFSNPKFIHDSTVAAFMVVAMFICPVFPGDADPAKRRVLDWDTARDIPWGLLLLFGGGIALAGGFQASGLSQWIGKGLNFLSDVPIWFAVFCLALSITFLTEITSNTAVTTLVMPILLITAIDIDTDPRILMIPAAISASCAFMFPVATAPNAIAFGSGFVSIKEMSRTGFFINLIGVAVITALSLLLI
ncbi:MAG: SLC13 family permease [Planctomycetota bacterium]|nr:SLC13 family permease [Planctomycetota bacterium]